MMKPNVVYILADDMGYGDVSCYNPEGRLPTPCIDSIAREGLTFTDAHATAAVCTPSRYSILTGRYCWRKMPYGIVSLFGDAIIPQSRMTVADLYGRNGYDTACIGKWHLGMTWQKQPDGSPDLTRPVLEGPMVNGFDSYYGIDIPNYPPFTMMEDNRVVKPLTAWCEETPDMTGASIAGPAEENWSFEEILPRVTDKACAYIRDHAHGEKPFFLYFPLTSPHTPLAVTDEFKGKSGLNNLYADLVLETDAMVGRVLDTLDQCGIREDTWVIFTTDNGCARYIGCDDLEAQGHHPSAWWRGYKADAWDGGHRIPLVMRWPGRIEAGSTCDQVISLGDFMATSAELLGDSLPPDAGEDSISFLPIMTGKGRSARTDMIQHSISGRFVVRKDRWKLILGPGSGGFEAEGFGGAPSDGKAKQEGLPPYQLYDLQADPGEQHNLYGTNLEKAQELLEILEDTIRRGRSTPGPDQKNDIEVVIDQEIQGTPVLEE